MRALVVGATGLVGHCLWRGWRKRGWDVAGTYRDRPFPGMKPADILRPETLSALCREHKPDVVALLASNPYVDYCEKNPEETRRINVSATVDAAEVARDAGACFVFFSSDYVFDGQKGAYTEKDEPRPLNAYGRQKLEAERAVAALGPEHLILRISGVFGWELARKNFVLQVVDKLGRGEKLKVVDDLRYCPTYAPALSDVLAELLEKKKRGLYHAAGKDEVSKYELAVEVAKAFGVSTGSIERTSMKVFPNIAPRPARSTLLTEKLRRDVKASLSGLHDGLADMNRTRKEWDEYSRQTVP